MQQTTRGLKTLAYLQSGAGAIDSAVTVASLFASGAIPLGTVMLLLQPETQAIRMRDDGTSPTAAVGYPVAVGVEFSYMVAQMPGLKVISQVAGAILNVWAFGEL